MNVFIVGPGGVGKSASGALLADALHFDLVDLDQWFCDRIANIGDYIRAHGYAAYCHANAALLADLLSQTTRDTVFVLSSGFLVHEECPEIAAMNAERIREAGVTVLLLPAHSVEESTEVVALRQMQRGFDLDATRERRKYRARHPRYLSHGDVQIFSMASPSVIAEQMQQALAAYL